MPQPEAYTRLVPSVPLPYAIDGTAHDEPLLPLDCKPSDVGTAHDEPLLPLVDCEPSDVGTDRGAVAAAASEPLGCRPAAMPEIGSAYTADAIRSADGPIARAAAPIAAAARAHLQPAAAQPLCRGPKAAAGRCHIEVSRKPESHSRELCSAHRRCASCSAQH